MPFIYGLPLIGVLLIALVIVRDIARRDRERRLQRGHRIKGTATTIRRSERSQMREANDHNTVIDTIIRTESGMRKREPPNA